jgi:hypothetical protein
LKEGPKIVTMSEQSDADRHASISRDVLLSTARGLRFGQRLFSRLPSAPRCKLCGSPFDGAAGNVMRLIGKAPWPGHPKYCSACFRQMIQHRAGAEIEISLLFADVRGSIRWRNEGPQGNFEP